MLPSIINSAEPFFYQGGPVGCLLIHGFTGAPKEMRQMGEYLADKGYSVLGVRLAGHATSPRDMLRTTWQDWFFSASDGWHMLNTAGKSIFVVGLSMGGVLSLTLASHFPVEGVIAMSSPYSLPDDPRLPFIRPLSLLVRNVGKGESDWKNPELEKDHVDYPYYPTRSVAELRDLLTVMRERLPSVTAPTLLVQSKEDKAIPAGSAQSIYDRLGCKDKEILWVENSGHVVCRDLACSTVFEAAHQFIQKVVQVGG